MSIKVEEIPEGTRFGHWTVCVGRRRIQEPGGGWRYIIAVRCVCGKECENVVSLLKKGKSKSCGCSEEKPIKHGHLSGKNGKSREYATWQNMLSRCGNPNFPRYNVYGGRGIFVCEQWRSFENFIFDMGLKPAINSQIDRIDNNGNYEPSNCRWLSPKQNANNRSTCRRIEFHGISLTMSEWADRLGTGYSVFVGRVNRGWQPSYGDVHPEP
jgi:hypothetical protein